MNFIVVAKLTSRMTCKIGGDTATEQLPGRQVVIDTAIANANDFHECRNFRTSVIKVRAARHRSCVRASVQSRRSRRRMHRAICGHLPGSGHCLCSTGILFPLTAIPAAAARRSSSRGGSPVAVPVTTTASAPYRDASLADSANGRASTMVAYLTWMSARISTSATGLVAVPHKALGIYVELAITRSRHSVDKIVAAYEPGSGSGGNLQRRAGVVKQYLAADDDVVAG